MSQAGEAAFLVAEPLTRWGREKSRHAGLRRRRQAAELVGVEEPASLGHWRLAERCSSSEPWGPGSLKLSGTEQLAGDEHGQVVANVDAVEQRWGVRASLGYAHPSSEAGCDAEEPGYGERVGGGTVGDAFCFEEVGAAGASVAGGECRAGVGDVEEPGYGECLGSDVVREAFGFEEGCAAEASVAGGECRAGVGDVEEPGYGECLDSNALRDAFVFEEAGAAAEGECRAGVGDVEEPLRADSSGRHALNDSTSKWSGDRSSNWSDDWTSKRSGGSTNNWSDPDQLASLAGRVDAAVSDLRFAKGPLRERAKEIDELLVQVVRGRGCLDLAVGGLLAQMLDGDHMLKMGFSTRRDYIREVLDAPPRTALEMAQVARALPERPLLRQAVLEGRVGWRKALLILDVAKGDEEAIWVSIAEDESHRSLKKMVKARGVLVEEEEKYVSKTLRLFSEQRAKVDEAERLCRLELGADAKRHQCLRATAEEYMGAHGVPLREEQRAVTGGEENSAKKEEKESLRWVKVWEEHARKVRAVDARRQESGRGGGLGEDRNPSARHNGASAEPGWHRKPSAHSNGASAEPGSNRNSSAHSNGESVGPDWHRNLSARTDGPSAESGWNRNPSAHSNGESVGPDWDQNPSAHSNGASAGPGWHRNPSAHSNGASADPCWRRNSSAHTNGTSAESDWHRNPSAHSNGASFGPDWDRKTSAHSSGADHLDPHAITARLQSLVRARKDWDNLLGPLAWAMKEHKLWRHIDTTYTSLTHYCTDRLGICERTLRQHAWLEARLQALPQLRQAYESRKLSFMKTRAIAKVATPFNVEEKISDAKDRTSLSVEHEADQEEDRNLSARGRMRLFGPEESMTTIRMAMERAQELAREGGEGYITPGEALSRVAEHFVDVWKDQVELPKGRRARILRRCEGICEVPECSRAAHHLHHIVYRSHGGKNEDSNMVALCPAHHLRGIHHGYMRVKGKAGARVVWEMALQGVQTKETYVSKLGGPPRKVEL